jgi:hypothetical protein
MMHTFCTNEQKTGRLFFVLIPILFKTETSYLAKVKSTEEKAPNANNHRLTVCNLRSKQPNLKNSEMHIYLPPRLQAC